MEQTRQFLRTKQGENDLKKFRSVAQLLNFRQDNGESLTAGNLNQLAELVREAFENLPHVRRISDNAFLSVWIADDDHSSEDIYLKIYQAEKRKPKHMDVVIQKWFNLVNHQGMALTYLNQLLTMSKAKGWKPNQTKRFKQQANEFLKSDLSTESGPEREKLRQIIAGMELELTLPKNKPIIGPKTRI